MCRSWYRNPVGPQDRSLPRQEQNIHSLLLVIACESPKGRYVCFRTAQKQFRMSFIDEVVSSVLYTTSESLALSENHTGCCDFRESGAAIGRRPAASSLRSSSPLQHIIERAQGAPGEPKRHMAGNFNTGALSHRRRHGPNRRCSGCNVDA